MVWSPEEIAAYQPLDDSRLVALYASAYGNTGDEVIPATNPEGRAFYLSEVILDLTAIDHEVIMRTAAKEGRPAAMSLLEQMALNSLE